MSNILWRWFKRCQAKLTGRQSRCDEGFLALVHDQDVGARIPELYRACRKACGPPMVKIESLDVGELWFYYRHAMVTVCLGDQSLLVAYDTHGPRDDVVAQFHSAHAWLRGEFSDPPAKLNLRFAVWEETPGNGLVRLYKPGDWQYIAFIKAHGTRVSSRSNRSRNG